ncbi:hypothetical protein OAR33_00495 [bacterium]|nr:hypothetical protein [bacterium]
MTRSADTVGILRIEGVEVDGNTGVSKVGHPIDRNGPFVLIDLAILLILIILIILIIRLISIATP